MNIPHQPDASKPLLTCLAETNRTVQTGRYDTRPHLPSRTRPNITFPYSTAPYPTRPAEPKLTEPTHTQENETQPNLPYRTVHDPSKPHLAKTDHTPTNQDPPAVNYFFFRFLDRTIEIASNTGVSSTRRLYFLSQV